MSDSVFSVDGMNSKREIRRAQKESLSQWQSVNHRPHVDWHEVRPSTHRLRHPGTAVWGSSGNERRKTRLEIHVIQDVVAFVQPC
jgi:hypothetical protein